MQTLVIRQNRADSLRRQKAFTLIEIMVVLVLLGLVSSLVLPKLNIIYDNFIFRSQRDEALQKISSLGYQAYNQQQTIRIDTENAAQLLQLPEDLQLFTTAAIQYNANGFCQGGIISLQHEKLQADYQLIPPYCQPQRLER